MQVGEGADLRGERARQLVVTHIPVAQAVLVEKRGGGGVWGPMGEHSA